MQTVSKQCNHNLLFKKPIDVIFKGDKTMMFKHMIKCVCKLNSLLIMCVVYYVLRKNSKNTQTLAEIHLKKPRYKENCSHYVSTCQNETNKL